MSKRTPQKNQKQGVMDMNKLNLKQKILNEMVDKSPKEKIRTEIYKEIGYRYESYVWFNAEFERAYRKVKREKLKGEKI